MINNGFSTCLFHIKRCVRQGDLLSPYLFIITLELLAIYIRNNKDIRGIKINEKELKLVVFADDMASFVSDKLSYFSLINSIKSFSSLSGLKMNHEKAENLPLGNMVLHHQESGVEEIERAIKILVVYFTNDHVLFYKKNFDSIMKSVKEHL